MANFFHLEGSKYYLQSKLASGNQAHTYLYKDEIGNLHTVKLSDKVNNAICRQSLLREINILTQLRDQADSCQTQRYPCFITAAIVDQTSPSFQHFNNVISGQGLNSHHHNNSNDIGNSSSNNSIVPRSKDLPKFISVIIYRFVAGVTLESVIAEPDFNADFDAELLNKFLGQMLLTILTLHELNIVHRDIKPANIILSNNSSNYNSDYHFTLIDFGLAHQTSSHKESLASVAGTINYVYPKLMQSANNPTMIDLKRSDLFALGVCAYRYVNKLLPYTITTGRSPYGDTVYIYSRYRGFNSEIEIDSGLKALIEALLLDTKLEVNDAYGLWLRNQITV